MASSESGNIRLGVVRESQKTNPLIAKPELGRPRIPSRSLPGSDHVYGVTNVVREDGVAKALSGWAKAGGGGLAEGRRRNAPLPPPVPRDYRFDRVSEKDVSVGELVSNNFQKSWLAAQKRKQDEANKTRRLVASQAVTYVGGPILHTKASLGHSPALRAKMSSAKPASRPSSASSFKMKRFSNIRSKLLRPRAA